MGFDRHKRVSTGTTYEREWERQEARTDLPAGYLPVHRWYLRMEHPEDISQRPAPQDGLALTRAIKPGVHFYRFLYNNVGEEFLWGDRRRMSDEELLEKVNHDGIHVVVLYENGVPAGFFEANFREPDVTNINYFGLMPGFIGRGLGGYMLNSAIIYAARKRRTPLTLDTCSLDHPSALENYKRRGFELVHEEDEEYPDPRLDGTIRKDAGKHVPLAD